WSLRPVLSACTLRSSTRRCALIGCAVLLLQNLADLGLELPAVAALLCVVLGALSGAAKSGTESANDKVDERGEPRGAGLLLSSCAVAIGCLALTLCFSSDSPARLRRELYEQLGGGSPPSQAFWSSLERAVRAYPAEPYVPLLGSSGALAAGSNPLPWIARALERNPQNASTHLQLARVLRARGATEQAFGAVRHSLALDPGSLHSVFGLAREWKVSPATFEAAAPLGRAGAPLLLLLAEHTDDVTVRRHLLEEVLERDPDAADAHHRLAIDLLSELSLGEGGRCASRRESCLTELAQHVQRAAIPGNSRSVVLEGQLLAARGEPQRAEQFLEHGCQPFPGDVKCLREWVARALANQSSRLQDAVNAYVAAGCSNADGCAYAHMTLGTMFANAGRWHDALSHYQHATREAPTPEAWQAVASVAERLGDETTATDALRRVNLFARRQPEVLATEPAAVTPAPPETALPTSKP
ncbi:MAG: lipopolysaccharide lipooligosaccharide O-antigen ligase, partial [Pseudomonadota bacterium]